MKKILLLTFMLMFSVILNAQIVENFDSNKFGWIETVQRDGKTIITEGVMRIEGKKPVENIWEINANSSRAITSCYAPFDPKKNFIFKCKAKANRISESGFFGLIFDYIDDFNHTAFYIAKFDKDVIVVYDKVVEKDIVGRRINTLKLKELKNTELSFELKSTYDKLELYCNNMLAMEIRHSPIESTGIGFIVMGQQIVDFDDVELIQ